MFQKVAGSAVVVCSFRAKTAQLTLYGRACLRAGIHGFISDPATFWNIIGTQKLTIFGSGVEKLFAKQFICPTNTATNPNLC
jgi:adenine deaminase